MNKLPDFDESKLLKNPFSYSLKIDVTKNVENSKLKPDKDGIMLPAIWFSERQPATKLFHAPGIIDVVSNLSDGAMRLFLYVAYSVERGKDYIQINTERYLKKNNILSKRTYTTALNELIRYGFIVQSEFDSVYWINPIIFFCGNRIAKYPECKVIKGERERS